MRVKEAIKMIEGDGWYLDRQMGGHRQYKHADKKGVVTIALHPMSDEIAKGGAINIDNVSLVDLTINPWARENYGNETLHEGGIMVMPNPANERVTLHISNTTLPLKVIVWNASGKIIADFISFTSELTLPVSAFPYGEYFVEACDAAGKKFTCSFIKQ
ncbi:MAG: type II toxin-antitoxin system HicA family toxin [Chitinophagales bacterium]